jgi:hypothetical protein
MRNLLRTNYELYKCCPYIVLNLVLTELSMIENISFEQFELFLLSQYLRNGALQHMAVCIIGIAICIKLKLTLKKIQN